jgi:hypothetical protein
MIPASQWTLQKLTTTCQGLIGIQGRVGPIGPTGAVGVSGPSGPSGLQGQTGPTGALGSIGSTGASGRIGDTGPRGFVGTLGVSGPTGPSGSIGSTGNNGSTGSTGPSGPSGPRGPSGASGPIGPSGPTGPGGPTVPTMEHYASGIFQTALSTTTGFLTLTDVLANNTALKGYYSVHVIQFVGTETPDTAETFIYTTNTASAVLAVFPTENMTDVAVMLSNFYEDGGASLRADVVENDVIISAVTTTAGYYVYYVFKENITI